MPPDMIRHVRQEGTHGDCGIATLATYLGVTYEEVLIEAAKVRRNVLKVGLHWKDMIKVAERFQTTLVVAKFDADDLDDITGVIGLKRMNPDSSATQLTQEHVVYLWLGRIIDGDGDHWADPEDYFKTTNFEMTGVLVALEGA